MCVEEESVSVFDQINFVVNAYNCKICGKWHKKGSKKFEEHFDANCGNQKSMIRPIKEEADDAE